jgi:DNA-binding response OmpR family regulator
MTNRVLLVEDDDDIREAVGDGLRSQGYEVVTAANGLIARDWLRNAGVLPNVILLDLMMPVMDGWQFRSEQLLDGALAAIPVIILSGAGDVGKEAAALGAAGYVTKPFNIEALIGVVERSCHAS